MGKIDVWPAVHEQRRALLTDLKQLTDDGWMTGSLCTGWSVRDVVAHMIATARITPASFFGKIIGSGFSLTKMQAKDIIAARGASPADTLAGFESVLTSVKHPPGPTDTVLGETIIHSEDIRRPLALQHDYPFEVLVQVADFYKGSNLILGTKRRITGLTLKATDTDWSHGSGPEVAGPMVRLVMAMTGRRAALADLTGEGVETLASRP